jgi:hypothetical protein
MYFLLLKIGAVGPRPLLGDEASLCLEVHRHPVRKARPKRMGATRTAHTLPKRVLGLYPWDTVEVRDYFPESRETILEIATPG